MTYVTKRSEDYNGVPFKIPESIVLESHSFFLKPKLRPSLGSHYSKSRLQIAI